jgi:Beta/Gamma crystallin
MGDAMNLKSVLFIGGLSITFQVAAQVTFYEHDDFRGRSFASGKQISNFERFGFNDRASSARVRSGRWEVCTDAQFSGRCVILQRGDYRSFRQLGLNDRVSSIRRVSHANRNDGPRQGVYERRRDDYRY